MTTETSEDIAVATLSATSTPAPVLPRALAEMLVWARHFWNSWTLVAMCTTVIVRFQRSGQYGFQDFLLLLLLHACDTEARLRRTLQEARPFTEEIMSIWARSAMPSQSQLSRWLARVDEATVRAFRTLFCPMYVRTG